jgi:DNA-binding NarL/FixJ family response regulator
VSVVIAGLPGVQLDALLDAVTELSSGPPTEWQVRRATGPLDDDHVDILLCDSPSDVRNARYRWPKANVLMLVPSHGSETAVVAALEAGAHVCVRDAEPAVIAAFLHSIARRRRLGTGGTR